MHILVRTSHHTSIPPTPTVHVHPPHTPTPTPSPHTHTYLQGVPSSLDVGVVHQEGRGEDGGEEEEADPREAFQDGPSKGGDGDQGLGA